MTASHSPQKAQSSRRRISAVFACSAVIVSSLFWSPALLSHGNLTTTVLFDREIVRILDKHCVMCHAEGSLSFPLETYEQTWVQGKKIHAVVLARHMPPWAAVPGYGQFVNENNLTLRETQFVVSWVEGLGPRNSGTVFSNVVDGGVRPPAVRALAHTGHWMLGEPDLTRQLPPNTIAPQQPDGVRRTVIDLGLKEERRVRAVEFMPGDRRVVRAAFFTVQETGQWIGSWTPWHGMMELPEAAAYRLRAGSHVVAEIHYRSASEAVVDSGTLGVFFANSQRTSVVSDLVLDAKRVAPAGGALRLRAEALLTADTHALALWPDVATGLTSIEVAARSPDGGTDILLFVRNPPKEWPTPYIFRAPVLLRKGTKVSVVAYSTMPAPDGVRLRISRY